MITLPASFINSVKEHFPKHADQVLDAYNQLPPVSIRIHPDKCGALPNLAGVPWNPHGYYLSSRPSFTEDPWIHAGAYYVQEASSMFVGYAVSFLHQQKFLSTVLDLCAAPGGKTTDMLSVIPEHAHVVANEVSGARSKVLFENLSKWGKGAPTVLNTSAARIADVLPGYFDLILADAPCSGEGLFRRMPDYCSEWHPQMKHGCAQRQATILEDVWPALAEGGYLIYSTCTLNAVENESTVKQWIQDGRARSVPLPIEQQWGVVQTDCGGYYFLPGLVHGEGFYCCVLQKVEEAQRHPPAKRRATKSASKPPSQMFDQHGFSKMLFDDVWYYIHEAAQHWLSRFKPHEVVAPGVPAFQNDSHIPTHQLALNSTFKPPHAPKIELDHAQALVYLRREALPIACEKGLVQLTFHALPLGWGRSVGTRINNLYPKTWAVRSTHFKASFSLAHFS